LYNEDTHDDSKYSTKRSAREKKSIFYCKDLQTDYMPLEKADLLLPFPYTKHCQWTFDESSHMLLANFKVKKEVTINPTDYRFLLQMMERDDISLIIDGLAQSFDGIWDLDWIQDNAGHLFFHRIRAFRRVTVDKTGRKVRGKEGYSMYRKNKIVSNDNQRLYSLSFSAICLL